MSKLSFKYIPLTFISSESEIQRQIRNTIVFSYLYNKYNDVREFSSIIESTQYGYNTSANNIGAHKFLRISDIKEGIVDWNNVPHCDCADEKKYKLFKNDILVARTGGTTGKSFLINQVPNNAVFAGYLIRLRTKNNICPYFIYEFLNSYTYWAQISEMKMGSAQPNVNAQKLKQLKIPFAPKHIVEEISKFLIGGKCNIPELDDLLKKGMTGCSSSSELSNLFNKQNVLIAELRQSILQEAVQGKLTANWRTCHPELVEGSHSAKALLVNIKAEKEQLIKDKKIKAEKMISSYTDDEIPFSIPSGWVWCRTQDLCPNISSGSTPPKPFFKDKGIPYLKVYNIRNQKINFSYREQFVDQEYHGTKLKRSILKPGDVIMNIVGPPLGKVAIIPDDYEEWNCNQAISFFQPLDRRISKWIYTFLCAGSFLKHIELIGTAGQDNISVTKSKTIMIPLPPIAEQQAITTKVNSLMDLCDELEKQVVASKANAEMLMQSVLREVFEKPVANELVTSEVTSE